jgi:hypothetical protein
MTKRTKKALLPKRPKSFCMVLLLLYKGSELDRNRRTLCAKASNILLLPECEELVD